jgi:CheY-like chemotaxis protein
MTIMPENEPLIIIVDDDPDSRLITRMILSPLAPRIEAFPEPDAAFAFMESNAPALIVSDLMMNSLTSGFDFAKRVKNDPRFSRIPLIMLTAVAGKLGFDFKPRTDADLTAMNVDAFFEKPPQPELLLAKVRELLSAAAKGNQ